MVVVLDAVESEVFRVTVGIPWHAIQTPASTRTSVCYDDGFVA